MEDVFAFIPTERNSLDYFKMNIGSTLLNKYFAASHLSMVSTQESWISFSYYTGPRANKWGSITKGSFRNRLDDGFIFFSSKFTIASQFDDNILDYNVKKNIAEVGLRNETLGIEVSVMCNYSFYSLITFSSMRHNYSACKRRKSHIGTSCI